MQLLKQNPSNEDRKASLADVQVRLGTAETELQASDDAEKLAATGLVTLTGLAAKHPDSVWMLDFAVAALITVKPATLRDPKLAIVCAEREALLTKRKQPSALLSVAQAYRSAGLNKQARTAAIEGLALLPLVSASAPIPRIRKLLELETEAKRGSM